MIDFILGLYFAGLFVRGWLRGFARELMDLIGLIVGLALAFRLSGPAGQFVHNWAGTSDGVSRLIGGFVIFLAVGIVASVGAHFLQRIFSLPGLALSNRLLGALLALTWALFLAVLILTLMAVLPLPPSIGDQLDNSKVAGYLTDPDSPAQAVFQSIAGDRVLEALLNLEDLVGGSEVILQEGETLELPAAAADDLTIDDEAATEIFDLLNRSRVEEGLDPLAWSAALADVGQAYATEMYLGGFFSHESPVSGNVADRVKKAGIPYRILGENLALAATPQIVHDGLMASPGHRENILRPEFTRVGIGVVAGPLGLMVVQVFQG
ncbi:MAG: hypothetical protein GWP04_09070 [Gammaproteobacteria bacterium]|nr:hypothetical protein [Gammaproteobacteria bacterium]